MDKIGKALRRLGLKEKRRLKEILLEVSSSKLTGLDVQKLKGRKDVFRVRKGDMRIIFRKIDNEVKILILERRSNKTYKIKSYL